MPSLKTRLAYSNLALGSAQRSLANSAQAVAVASSTLGNLAAGTFDLQAVTVGGVRFVNTSGVLKPAP